MAYHFWYSEQREINDYINFASAIEFGMVTTLDMPHRNTCTLSIAGEEIEVVYNFCAEKRDAYDKWNIHDLNYLGSSDKNVKVRYMKIPEIVARMEELQVPVPSILLKQMGK